MSWSVDPVAGQVVQHPFHRRTGKFVADVAGPHQLLGRRQRFAADRERDARVAEHRRAGRVDGTRLIDLRCVDLVRTGVKPVTVSKNRRRRIAGDLGAAAIEQHLADQTLRFPIAHVPAPAAPHVDLPQRQRETAREGQRAESGCRAAPAGRGARARGRSARSTRSAAGVEERQRRCSSPAAPSSADRRRRRACRSRAATPRGRRPAPRSRRPSAPPPRPP